MEDIEKENLSEIKNMIFDLWDTIEKRFQSRNYTYGVPTDFYEYDMFLGGLHKSELTVIAGRHSMGKTSFAINLMNNLALKSQIPALYISYEMNKIILTTRIISSYAEVEIKRINTANLTKGDFEKLTQAIQDIAQSGKDDNFNIISSCTYNFDELADEVRNFVELHPDGVVIIDYFQLIKLNKEEDKYQQMSVNAAALKRLAIELDIPLVLLSEVNKKCEERPDKRPLLSDLFECDALAQHADNVIFIYRDEYYWKTVDDEENNFDVKGIAEIIVAKQKNGSPGLFKLLFQPNICKFKNPIKSDTF